MLKSIQMIKRNPKRFEYAFDRHVSKRVLNNAYKIGQQGAQVEKKSKIMII